MDNEYRCAYRPYRRGGSWNVGVSEMTTGGVTVTPHETGTKMPYKDRCKEIASM